jgi:ABC-type antimicrobial peptide transport system permease subunit
VSGWLPPRAAYDPGAWGTTIAAIAATAVASAWLPAHRASRIDPVLSLRDA